LQHPLGPELAARVPLFAGDIVPAKKPDPAIYRLTLAKLELDPAGTLGVEDSRNGPLPATGGALLVLVSGDASTREGRFDEAVLVVSELGDPGGPPIEMLANRSAAHPGDYNTLDDLRDC